MFLDCCAGCFGLHVNLQQHSLLIEYMPKTHWPLQTMPSMASSHQKTAITSQDLNALETSFQSFIVNTSQHKTFISRFLKKFNMHILL